MISVLRAVLLAVLVLLMTGCASTQIKSVWKDPAYLARPQKIMVVAVFHEPVYRRIVEDEFVLQFRLRGVEAIASYTALPDKHQNDEVAIEKMVKQAGADAVLVTRMVSKRSVRVYYPAEVTYRPRYYGRWPDFYRSGYDVFSRPGYSTRYEYALMETNLYDVSMDHLVWAATTETGMENLSQSLIKPYIGSLMKLMSEYGLVRE